jgi:hypothetical protein
MRIYQSEAGELPSRDSEGDLMIEEEFIWMRPLYSRKYWTRLWIVQELILAKEVVICCGTKSVGLGDIYGLSLDWGSFGQAFSAGTYVEPHKEKDNFEAFLLQGFLFPLNSTLFNST